MSMSLERSNALTGMMRTLEEGGFDRVDPPILQPAEVFLDLSGEELRRRLFQVQDPAGRELCLRPDMTIPVSRHHLGTGDPLRAADYCYLGPVFRHRPGSDEPDEFMQAGIESFGTEDYAAADARIVALGVTAARGLGAQNLTLKIGDPTLLLGFVAALDVPAAWQRRLRSAFGTEGGVKGMLKNAGEEAAGSAAYASALARLDPQAARSLVSEMVDIAGIASVGGRSADEIAERLIERASLSGGNALDDGTRELITRFMDIDALPEDAMAEISTLAEEADIDAAPALEAFAARLDAMSQVGIDAANIRFSASFGRRLDYYSGFVFEASAPNIAAGPVVAGGRYDALLELLGAPQPVPGVGCAIWIDRAFAAGGSR
ncbi:ATP phosphoribosyltransferase regulatory subunit [Tepidamorphus sp. 3E244]|uniref:ATP phosphoribosyltransferase regulatory subunit n=1 Tax=Tepidamorphus sp. 3E244 TaxID=3385498 RepID=UPI0038FD25FD